MSIQALIFSGDSPKAQPRQGEIDLAEISASATKEFAGPPTAYLVRVEDLGALRNGEARAHFEDRKTKHRAKPLSKLMLGRRLIPLIDGRHIHPGQCVRSVRNLLQKAAVLGEHRRYIVGASPPIFDELWRQATRLAAAEAGLGDMAVHEGLGEAWQELLRQVRHERVPAGLQQKFVGQSGRAQLVRHLIVRAATVSHPVLILGETGTGKEIIARQIHALSERKNATFVPVNCAAIPDNLFESELFGHLKGAFTGAAFDKTGLWAHAHRGTLFLDEIGELSLSHQAKILRALEDGRIRPVGAKAEAATDARVIAATNRNLHEMTQAGRFREDLYYRLCAFPIRTPALREHPEDIPPLANFLWRAITEKASARLPEALIRELGNYRWPGNARELKAVLTNLHTLVGCERADVEVFRSVMEFQRGD